MQWFIYWLSRLDKKEKGSNKLKKWRWKMFRMHIVMKKLSGIQKGFQTLNCLQINIIGKNKLSIKNISLEKVWKKNNPVIALNILYTKEKKNASDLYFKSWPNPWKSNNCINYYKQRKSRVVLSCSNKAVYIIKRKNIKTSCGFILLELSSFF